jgi:hypothetical protein
VRCPERINQSNSSQKLAYVAQIIRGNEANHIMLTAQLLLGKLSRK